MHQIRFKPTAGGGEENKVDKTVVVSTNSYGNYTTTKRRIASYGTTALLVFDPDDMTGIVYALLAPAIPTTAIAAALLVIKYSSASSTTAVEVVGESVYDDRGTCGSDPSATNTEGFREACHRWSLICEGGRGEWGGCVCVCLSLCNCQNKKKRINRKSY